jgi:cellulose synthase/poly-beta-1,6-N-acetylglucosamine synthase-like glycosyltransferase
MHDTDPDPPEPTATLAEASELERPSAEDVAATALAERLRWSIDGLYDAFPALSVRRLWSRRQLVGLAGFGALFLATLVLTPIWTLTVVMGALVASYGIALWFRIDLARRSTVRSLRVEVSEDEARALSDDELPIYSVLVPAYREPEVLTQLVANLAALDYPDAKLDVKLLLESDDTATITATEQLDLPAFVEVVLVPAAQPRTKPKACNYGLLACRGEYVTIYDAEDRPDPLQLRKVVVAFANSEPDIACIQAELAYYNADENILTRWFAVEYRMWFTQFLTGLAGAGAPIPLGGTSNHIRTDVLVKVGAWDAYNVTEDADLGIRLHRGGYRVGLVDSVTYEEANNDAVNWIKQRSRWYKGYLQTWLLHMRNPRQLIRDIGFGGFVRFNAFVGGTPALALINPVSWLLVLLWFTVKPVFIQQIMPAPIYYTGLTSWLVGNIALYYLTLVAAYEMNVRRVFLAVLLLPVYWVLMSLAAIKAAWQLVVSPNYWEKTTHGLSAHFAPGGVTGAPAA